MSNSTVDMNEAIIKTRQAERRRCARIARLHGNFWREAAVVKPEIAAQMRSIASACDEVAQDIEDAPL